MAEWLNAEVLKTFEGASPPGVRIPLPPPKEYIMKIKIFIFLCIFTFIPSMAVSGTIDVLYNQEGIIVNTHYNSPPDSSANVIITVDLIFEDGRYVKCIDWYTSGSAFLGFSRVGSPSQINFVPSDVECIKIKR